MDDSLRSRSYLIHSCRSSSPFRSTVFPVLFQQDNAVIVQACFKEHDKALEVVSLRWPLMSPDLNICGTYFTYDSSNAVWECYGTMLLQMVWMTSCNVLLDDESFGDWAPLSRWDGLSVMDSNFFSDFLLLIDSPVFVQWYCTNESETCRSTSKFHVRYYSTPSVVLMDVLELGDYMEDLDNIRQMLLILWLSPWVPGAVMTLSLDPWLSCLDHFW